MGAIGHATAASQITGRALIKAHAMKAVGRSKHGPTGHGLAALIAIGATGRSYLVTRRLQQD